VSADRVQAERDWLAAALRRLASEEWLGTEGYSGNELERRVDFARDKLAAVAPLPLPGEAQSRTLAEVTQQRDDLRELAAELLNDAIASPALDGRIERAQALGVKGWDGDPIGASLSDAIEERDQ
jgi:hypothetical protein